MNARPDEQENGAVLKGLHGLRDVETPDLLPGVLTQVGLGDRYGSVDTPLGPVFVAYNDHGISAIRLAESEAAFERKFRADFGRPAYRVAELPEALRRGIVRQLRGEHADLHFDLRGLTEFERAVLRKALEIPRGEIRPYSWIAREIGRPRAVRAVGSALARNPIPLLIPCHRVVRSDGMIGNYGLGGPANKRTVLAAEGVDPEEVERLARSGSRFVGSDTTHVYCFPTCRHARRITTGHRQPFRSITEAEAAGYRPCRVCRPSEMAVSA